MNQQNMVLFDICYLDSSGQRIFVVSSLENAELNAAEVKDLLVAFLLNEDRDATWENLYLVWDNQDDWVTLQQYLKLHDLEFDEITSDHMLIWTDPLI